MIYHDYVILKTYHAEQAQLQREAAMARLARLRQDVLERIVRQVRRRKLEAR